MTEWNPDDPDATSVYYDLGAWTHDQRAEVAAELAEAGLPHAWDGDELIVPEACEADVDEMFVVLEARLGIDDAADGADGDAADVLPEAEPFDDTAPTTEYDLADWSALERTAIANALRIAHIPHQWDGGVLLVPTDAEDLVDDLLDEVERLDADASEGSDDGSAGHALAPPPYAVVSDLFLASTRLQRDALDEDGLDQLHAVLETTDPTVPPVGVAPPLWGQAWEIGRSIADAISVDDDLDTDAVSGAARQLRELLAPLV